MKEHQSPYWGEKSKYWSSHPEDEDSYTYGNRHYKRGEKDAKKGGDYLPPTKNHEDSYQQGYHSGGG